MTTIEGYLDSATVILFGLFVKLLLASMFFVFWMRTPRARWFAWWAGSLIFGSVAAGNVLLHGFRPEFISLGITVAALIVTFGFCWYGARAFEGRSPMWFPLLVALGATAPEFKRRKRDR
jgi:hypothetical protein